MLCAKLMEIMLYLYTNWVRITSVSMVLDLDIEFFSRQLRYVIIEFFTFQPRSIIYIMTENCRLKCECIHKHTKTHDWPTSNMNIRTKITFIIYFEDDSPNQPNQWEGFVSECSMYYINVYVLMSENEQLDDFLTCSYTTKRTHELAMMVRIFSFTRLQSYFSYISL